MKKCRWNIRRSAWAFFVILCCHGNFADDPIPAILQPQKLFHITPSKDQTTPASNIDTPIIPPASESSLPEHPTLLPEKIVLASDEPLVVHRAPEDAVDASAHSNPLPLPFLLQDGPEAGVKTASSSTARTLNPPSTADPSKISLPSIPLDGDNVNRIQLPEKDKEILEDDTPLPTDVGEVEAHSVHLADAKAETGDDVSVEALTEPSLSELPLEVMSSADSVETAEATADVSSTADSIEAAAAGDPEMAVEKAAFVQEVDPVQDPPVVDSGTPTTEDMPSFNEWTKKRLEEQVKHGQHPPSATSQQGKVPTKQMRHKNYASIDCGAKVISANPEAQSTAAVLSHYRDDYMLNPCTARIWLIIELCESIQADRIDLANYELFSSSPREFSVYSSDRYPPRDWSFLGTFEAKDERSEQNFTIGHSTFGKYIKVEVGSHYGSEHFCPLSLVRVFGTSEYEALETEDRVEESADSQDVRDPLEDDELLGDHVPSHESKNLFGSAKDAVINIVKKAAEALCSEKSEEVTTEDVQSERSNLIGSNSQLLKWPRNCVCLQRMPHSDCEQGFDDIAVKTRCRKQEAIAHLQCNYLELYHFLAHTWPHSFSGVFSEKCSSSCQLHLLDCDAADHVSVGEESVHGACRFYRAAFGSSRFGALCQLDKLLQDERRNVPIVKPSCRYPSKSTSNVSLPSLDVVHFPKSTPPVLVEATPSHAVYEKLSQVCDGSYACSSGDQATACFSPVVPKPTSYDCQLDGTDPVIKTGIISEAGFPSGVVSGDKVTKNQISPTKTLPNNIKLSMNSNVVQDDRSQIGVDKPDSSAKVVPPRSPVAVVGKDVSKDDFVPVVSDGQPPKKQKPILAIADLMQKSVIANNGSINAVIEEGAVTYTLDGEWLPESLVAPSMSTSVPVQPDVSDKPSNEDHLVPPASVVLDADANLDPMIDNESSALEEDGSAATITSRGGDAAAAGNGRVGNSQTGSLVPNQKESVFVRLSNRIKALELNMSLSGQYLEELSRRYRKQMEEMQKAFNKTIGALNETARKAYERDLRQQEIIRTLQTQLENISKVVLNLEEQQENLHASVVSRHIVLMVIEVLVMAALFLACVRSNNHHPHSCVDRAVSVVRPTVSQKRAGSESNLKREPQDGTSRRRNSDSNVGSRSSKSTSAGSVSAQHLQDRRRASTEALNVSGTYSDLLIVEPLIPVLVDRPTPKDFDHPKKRKRQRNKAQGQGKTQLYRSVSSNVLPSNGSQKPPKVSLSRKSSATEVSSAGLLFATTGAKRSEIQDFGPLKRKQSVDAAPPARPQVDRISSLPFATSHLHLQRCPNQLNGSIRCPSLSDLMFYGGYVPELAPKAASSGKRPESATSHVLNGHRMPLQPTHRDNFALKKVCG